MLEALFIKYFTPIDINKLSKDWNLLRSTRLGEHTLETLDAEKRFNSPACSAYYKEIKPDTANEKFIEEIIERTIEKYIAKTSIRKK